MSLIATAKTVAPNIGMLPRRRVSYFGLTREKHCMNCGRLILEESDLYSRRFCSLECKEEYCSPIKHTVKQV